MSSTTPDLHAGLRAWARGSATRTAAVELLIRNGRVIHERAPWLTSHDDGNVSVVRSALQAGTGAYSSGERAVIDIAVSLLEGTPIDLSNVVPALDYADAQLVLSAIATAAGFSATTKSIETGQDGTPRLVEQPALYPFPAERDPLLAG